MMEGRKEGREEAHNCFPACENGIRRRRRRRRRRRKRRKRRKK